MKFKFFQSSRSFKNAKTQKGFTLIELIIALAVIGTAVGGILVFQNTAENRQKLLGATNAFSLMVGKMKNVWGSSGSFTGVSSTNLAGGGIVEAPFTVNGSNVVDPWGNNMSVNTSTNGKFTALTVQIPNADSCAAFASAVMSTVDRMNIHAAAPSYTPGATDLATFAAGGASIATPKAGPGAAVDAGAIAVGCGKSTRILSMVFQYQQ